MTNFQTYCLILLLVAVPYCALVLGPVDLPGLKTYILYAPIVPILVFGIYAAFTVLYRTFTFNDCPAAAKELQKEIEEARKDLIDKGFQFRD